MTPADVGVVAKLEIAHRAGRTVTILLDYDGTLTPIVEHPQLARLPTERRELLASLARVPGVALGIVSGRMLAELRVLVGLDGLYYAGTGGMEIDLLGRRVHHPAEAEGAELIATVASKLEPLHGTWTSSWIERKPAGITIHYRAVPPEQRQHFLESIDLTLEPWLPHLSLLGGPMALELLPRVGWNKGSAVRIILDHIGRDRATPIYAGDEANDGHAFDAVNAAGGMAIGVGPQAPTTAAYWLADPDALGALLRDLRGVLTASSSPSHR